MRKLLLTAFLAFSFSLMLFPGLPPAARAREMRKTLSRQPDPVVARGNVTSPFRGKKIDNMRLYARHGKIWEPVPYQIDKVNADGDYFVNENTITPEVGDEAGFDDVPEAKKRENRIKEFERRRHDYEKMIQKGQMTRNQLKEFERIACFTEEMERLDWNDELVFMARDSGDRALGSEWLTPDAIEIQVTDPLNGRQAWVYLFYFNAGLPPPSSVDYVRYDPEKDRIVTRLLEIGFMPDKPLIVNSIIGKPPGQSLMPDILDRFKLRIRIEPIILFCVPIHFDENNAKGVTIGYKDGPVRLLRRNTFWITIAGIKLPFAPKMAMDFKFYENGLSGVADLYIPVDPKYFVCGGSAFTAGLDFNGNICGARVFTRDNQDIVIDGKMSEHEENLVRTDQDWIAGYLPNRAALIARMLYDPRIIAEGAKLDFYYLDDETLSDPPEDDEGRHLVGYTIPVKSLLEGKNYVGFEIYTAYDFEPDQVRELLNIDDHPLVVADTTAIPEF